MTHSIRLCTRNEVPAREASPNTTQNSTTIFLSRLVVSAMRAPHTAHQSGFPVYSCAFISDDLLVVGGGGGYSRTGVKNRLKLYRISDALKLEALSELELQQGDDVPVSMAGHVESQTVVCGISSASTEEQENRNCRKFSIGVDEHKFTPLVARSTLPPAKDDVYQRVTVLSPDAQLVAVSSQKDLSLLAYDTFAPAAESVHVSDGEIYDATMSQTHLVLVTNVNLLVYALPPSVRSKGKGKSEKEQLDIHTDTSLPAAKLVGTVDIPVMPGVPQGAKVVFRAARLHSSNSHFYSIVNVFLNNSNRKKSKTQAFVLKWNMAFSDDNAFSSTLDTIRKIGDRNVTCLDVSPDGRLLAVGVSDYSVGVLDANTLSPLLSILKAHEFPITTLRFNPSSRLLVSGGTDATIRIIAIPEKLGGLPWSMILLILFALLAVVIAVMWPR